MLAIVAPFVTPHGYEAIPRSRQQREAAISALNLIDRWGPDVIVTIDDDAQILVGTKFVDDPDVSIVMQGSTMIQLAMAISRPLMSMGSRRIWFLNPSAKR